MYRLERSARRLLHSDRHQVDRDAAALDLREVEQVIDQSNEPLEVPQRDFEELLHLIGDRASRPLHQQRERGLDGGQGGTELVADDGDELTLRSLRLRFGRHVAIEHQMAEHVPLRIQHRGHRALTGEPTREDELDPVAQWFAPGLKRQDLSGESLGVRQRAGERPMDALDRRTDHDLPGNPQELGHRAVSVRDLAVCHHENRGIARFDQRLEPAVL